MQRMRLLTVIFLAGLLAPLSYAAPAPMPNERVTKIENATLTGDPEFSTLTFHFDRAVTYEVDPQLDKKTINIIFHQASFGPALEYKTFEDFRIKNIGFKLLKGNTVAAIQLKDIKNAISHSLSPDGKTLTFRFKQREALMPLVSDTTTPEERAAKAKRDAEMAKKSQKMEKESGREAFQKCVTDMQKMDFKMARDDLEYFIDNFPKSVYMEKAMFMYAETLYAITMKERKYSPRAIDAYRVAMSKYPDSEAIPRASLRLGDLYYNQDMDIEALATYQGIFDKFPESKFTQRALLGRARIYVDRKLYYEAANELEKILLLYPASPEIRDAKFQIAEAFYLRGDYEQAYRVFESADKRWPSYIKQNPQTFYRYADTNLRMEKRDKARGLFADLANLYPTNANGLNAVNKLADIYLADGKTAVAVKLLNIQARAWPDQPPGVESRLRLAALGQAPQKVITAEEAALTPYPEYFDPLAAYNDVIKKHPDWEYAQEAMFQKAKLYHRNKRYIESVVTLRGFMRTYPDLAATPPVVGLVKENLFEMVRNFHSQDGSFAVLYTYYGNFDPFFADVRDPEIIMNVADAYYGMGMFGRSYEKYHRAEELLKGEQPERIAFGKGRALAALDDNAGAAAGLAPFMGNYAKSAYAPYALQILGDIYAAQENRPRALAAYRAGLDFSSSKGLLASYTAYRAGLASKLEKDYQGAIKYFKASIDRYQPYLDRIDDFYQKDSHFQLMEAAYRGGLYRDAIQYSSAAAAKFPEEKQVGWARFVKSDSEAKISEDEKALEGLKAIAKDEPSSMFGKVADATVGNAGWKIKNRNLFPY